MILQLEVISVPVLGQTQVLEEVILQPVVTLVPVLEQTHRLEVEIPLAALVVITMVVAFLMPILPPSKKGFPVIAMKL